ncbi:hypothetical protein Ahy_A05g025359 [Arachis hypogaea]|uniref:Uncharacterized protein n=1 Tax=Arachis hypogaea TaxID=3818 RepID=A0A445D872_ARAHY|nr:hypothetical protein Ahy_A05g025359 [Arachis hypogaea]
MLKQHRENQNFSFELNLEGDHSIKNAFWTDARCRAACEYFEDVFSFDTTYNTNRYSVHTGNTFRFITVPNVHFYKYNLVFGSFVGMNHHDQPTLLGCALMKNEDIQSFK